MALYAPIKEEYLKKVSKQSNEENESFEENINHLDNNDKNSANKARQRGTNKGRRQHTKACRDFARQLCPTFLSDQETPCKYGDKCRYEHDIRAYWNMREPDIQGQCHFFESNGHCPFMATCRWAGSHTDSKTLKQLRKNTNELEHTQSERNDENIVILKKLRKKQVDFKSIDSVVRTIKANREELTCAKMTEISKMYRDLTDSATESEPKKIKLTSTENMRKELSAEKLSGKLFLAPLTTVGNLPFRRICVNYGAEVTCGEMALATSLLKGVKSEWSLIRRHPCEKIFGIQLAGGYPDTMARICQILGDFDIDFVDINMGCPIDIICQKQAGAAMMNNPKRLRQVIEAMNVALSPHNIPITLKLRTGYNDGDNTAIPLLESLKYSSVALFTLHGRSRQQRYTKAADWDYIQQAAAACSPKPLIGCGDIFNYTDYYEHMENSSIDSCMIGRGALIKPWLFTEIKERRHWDISSSERFDILKRFANYGFEHWGSDVRGVENTRRFMLEWLSFLCRYVPVGLLERLPRRMNEKPMPYIGRDDLETLMASNRASDWVEISKRILGPVPDDFKFTPKHKANAF